MTPEKREARWTAIGFIAVVAVIWLPVLWKVLAG